eukprot:720430-Alexandrium_andersonii.AAC.1
MRQKEHWQRCSQSPLERRTVKRAMALATQHMLGEGRATPAPSAGPRGLPALARARDLLSHLRGQLLELPLGRDLHVEPLRVLAATADLDLQRGVRVLVCLLYTSPSPRD